MNGAVYPTPRQAHATLAILVAAYVLSFVDRQILSLLVGPIRQDLAISDFQMSLLQGLAFTMFYAVLGIPIGRLADRHTRKFIIAAGVILWSVMTAVCGLAHTFAMLFLARMLVGVGEATLSPSAYSLMSDSYPPHRLGRATSIFQLGITIGGGLAFLVGGTVVTLVATTDVVHIPLVGAVKPWQSAFFIVGLPGLLVGLLVLMIREPKRQGLAHDGDKAIAKMPVGTVVRFMWERRGVYGGVIASLSLMGIMGYGTLNWYPSFLIRTYGMTPGEVGLSFGLVYLVFGSLGAVGSALLAERLAARGYEDANLRTILLVAIALVPMAAGFLMPTPLLALMWAAPLAFLLNASAGLGVAALQLISPNQMRAVVTAVLLLCTNFIGGVLGASIIAFLTDYVFGNDLALRYSLATAIVCVAPLAGLAAWSAYKPYRAALISAKAWTG